MLRAKIIDPGDIKVFTAKLGNEVVEFNGNFNLQDDILTIKNFDIEGAGPNSLGFKKLTSLIQAFGKDQGVKQIVVEPARRTSGANPMRTSSQLKFNIDNK